MGVDFGLEKNEALDVATITAPGKLARFAETLFLHELSNSLVLQFKPRDGVINLLRQRGSGEVGSWFD